jgi:hypothetical protein
MTKEGIDAVEKDAKELLVRIDEVRKTMTISGGHLWGCKESGALRRQSMELTRSLSAMRRP